VWLVLSRASNAIRWKAKNMFSYYGSKSKIVHLYPSPKHGKVIEPFAGSARYALKWFDRDVLLVDKYDVVVKVWRYLQQASVKDIMSLPTLKLGDDIRTLKVSDEEKMFLGMLAGVASTSPRWKVSAYSAEQHGRKNQLKRIADQLYKIRHWIIRQGSYEDIENVEATWFIDPPYQVGGNGYKHKKIDYPALALWSKERNGQVIVCENTKADWMKFYPMKGLHGAMSETVEAFWSNYPHDYQFEQQSFLTPSNTAWSGLNPSVGTLPAVVNVQEGSEPA
jgi:16S rRNA G966 N2-methylase RsmD